MSSHSTHPQRLYLIEVATLLPDHAPIPCYLVQMSDGTNVLIDSGLPVPLPPGHNKPVLGKDVVEQLATLGLHPDDIHMLITTHFDVDHAGKHYAFTKAEIVVQRSHYAHSRTNHPRFADARPQWDLPTLHYRLVDGDTQLLPGLEVIETSGHTIGHQAVLVRLPETGVVLLAADAVPSKNSFTLGRKAGGFDEDEVALNASTQKLLNLVERERVSLVVFGHDAEQWQTLKKLPDFYS